MIWTIQCVCNIMDNTAFVRGVDANMFCSKHKCKLVGLGGALSAEA